MGKAKQRDALLLLWTQLCRFTVCPEATSTLNHCDIASNSFACGSLGADHMLRECERVKHLLGVTYVDALVMEWPGSLTPATPSQLRTLRYAAKNCSGCSHESNRSHYTVWLIEESCCSSSHPVVPTRAHVVLCRLESWRALQRLQEAGHCKSIGVANFTTRQLEALILDSGVPPQTIQVEYHPHLVRRAGTMCLTVSVAVV
jgi:diketogulonate reductase-like aldo/keto reductase